MAIASAPRSRLIVRASSRPTSRACLILPRACRATLESRHAVWLLRQKEVALSVLVLGGSSQIGHFLLPRLLELR